MDKKDLLLEVEDLKTTFSGKDGAVDVLDGISLKLHKNEVVAIVGESGCGKSVTARSILRILDTNGSISGGSIKLYRGSGMVDIAKQKNNSEVMNQIRRMDISMIFQEPMTAFSPVLTIGNQITEAAELYLKEAVKAGIIPKMKKKERRAWCGERVKKYLNLVNLTDPKIPQEYTFNLSGGMRQRAMIAMALISNPGILIADEPTTALDVTMQYQVLNLIRTAQKKTGMSTLFITHDLGVVAEIADTVCVMYMGKIVETASVYEIFKNPKHPYTKALMKSTVSLRGPIEKLEPIEGTVPRYSEIGNSCHFHTRCVNCIKGLCDCRMPETISMERQHDVACFLYSGEKAYE